MEFKTMISKADSIISSLKSEDVAGMDLEQLEQAYKSYRDAIGELPFGSLWAAGLKEEADAKARELDTVFNEVFPGM